MIYGACSNTDGWCGEGHPQFLMQLVWVGVVPLYFPEIPHPGTIFEVQCPGPNSFSFQWDNNDPQWPWGLSLNEVILFLQRCACYPGHSAGTAGWHLCVPSWAQCLILPTRPPSLLGHLLHFKAKQGCRGERSHKETNKGEVREQTVQAKPRAETVWGGIWKMGTL